MREIRTMSSLRVKANKLAELVSVPVVAMVICAFLAYVTFLLLG